jgi:hypothetical protein
VLLEANPTSDIASIRKIGGVVIGGRLFNKAELRMMLEKMASEAGQR